MVNDLTMVNFHTRNSTNTFPSYLQLVREQKQRLQEKSKVNESLTHQNKHLTTKLERAIDELKKIREQILVLQKERREVDARLVAQESILSGLREEKKLWSHELAHQGTLNFPS